MRSLIFVTIVYVVVDALRVQYWGILICSFFDYFKRTKYITLFKHLFQICDLASENRPYDIFNPNGVISIML